MHHWEKDQILLLLLYFLVDVFDVDGTGVVQCVVVDVYFLQRFGAWMQPDYGENGMRGRQSPHRLEKSSTLMEEQVAADILYSSFSFCFLRILYTISNETRTIQYSIRRGSVCSDLVAWGLPWQLL